MSGTNPTNAMTILGQTKDAVYIRLPKEIQGACVGGCDCPYCTKHPDQPPMWDTLVVPTGDRDKYGFTWTVHMPEPDREFFKRQGRKP